MTGMEVIDELKPDFTRDDDDDTVSYAFIQQQQKQLNCRESVTTLPSLGGVRSTTLW